MRRIRLITRRTITAVTGALALLYAGLALLNLGSPPADIMTAQQNPPRTIAILGATGTIGDGLLKAALSDSTIETIHVITRRPSPRIEAGVETGRVVMTLHYDYLDYSALDELLGSVDAVFWAIGLSAVGIEESAYREIHRDFPREFLAAWSKGGAQGDRSFHYVSGGGANPDSRMMWAREKANAESTLAKMGQRRGVTVISYRPAFVMPTEVEATFGKRVMHAIFAPIGLSVQAEQIGRAMLFTSARSRALKNGTVLENGDILSLSKS
ncbi:MAG: NAD-dependent epimerase/dehydratase family protein [Pseudomonadota bacterium]